MSVRRSTKTITRRFFLGSVAMRVFFCCWCEASGNLPTCYTIILGAAIVSSYETGRAALALQSSVATRSSLAGLMTCLTAVPGCASRDHPRTSHLSHCRWPIVR